MAGWAGPTNKGKKEDYSRSLKDNTTAACEQMFI